MCGSAACAGHFSDGLWLWPHLCVGCSRRVVYSRAKLCCADRLQVMHYPGIRKMSMAKKVVRDGRHAYIENGHFSGLIG